MYLEWSRVDPSGSILHTSIRFDFLAGGLLERSAYDTERGVEAVGHVREDEAPILALRQLDAEGMADARGLVDRGDVGHCETAVRNRSLPAWNRSAS